VTKHERIRDPSIARIAELAGASEVLIKLIEELKTGGNLARQLKCEQARPAVNGQPVADNPGISSPLQGEQRCFGYGRR
jgi:hypothetical protein